jgi:hypothetical protein
VPNADITPAPLVFATLEPVKESMLDGKEEAHLVHARLSSSGKS